MKIIKIFGLFILLSYSMQLSSSQQEDSSALRKEIPICDLTQSVQRGCLPCMYQRKMYRAGIKTLNSLRHKDMSGAFHGIGSDDDAVRRWTIVAQGLIQADKNDWWTDIFSPGAVRDTEYQARSLVRALKGNGLQLDEKTMSDLRRVDRLE